MTDLEKVQKTLERIVVVETNLKRGAFIVFIPFSILERIVVVETGVHVSMDKYHTRLSVSSNGSWWLKPLPAKLFDQQIFSFSILERIVVVETERDPHT